MEWTAPCTLQEIDRLTLTVRRFRYTAQLKMFYPRASGAPHVRVSVQRYAAHASLKTLVAVACALHLPSASFACAAHPHAT